VRDDDDDGSDDEGDDDDDDDDDDGSFESVKGGARDGSGSAWACR